MMDKVNENHSLDCETKIFTRKRNATNDEIYTELKTLFQSSFSGVFDLVCFFTIGSFRIVFKRKRQFTRKIHYRIL